MQSLINRQCSDLSGKLVRMIVGLFLTAMAPVAISQVATPPPAGHGASGVDAYVGVWRMFFHGKRIGELEFIKYKDQLAGSLTNAHASIGPDGVITMHQIPGSAPVAETAMSEGFLHFVVAEPFDSTIGFQMTLDGTDKARLLFNKKSPNGQTMDFDLTKVSWEENEKDVTH
jgi:hypothetical protein